MKSRQVYEVKPGHFKNLKCRTEKLTKPDDEEIQVEIKSIGLNFADVFCVLGLYSAAPKSAFTPGLEFAGIVRDTGKHTRKFKIGDRVMGVTRFGAYATVLNQKETYLAPLPDSWSFEEGSAYPVQAMTAYYGLFELGNLQSGQTVLIHSAAGGVGLWANRICKHYHCYTIGTVGGEAKIKLLQEEGYDKTIVRNPKNFRKQLLDALDTKSLHLVMDSIGGSIMKDGFRVMAPMGRLITFGSAHYTERTDKPNFIKLLWKYYKRPKIDPQNMITWNKSVMGFNLIYLFEHHEIMHRVLKHLSQMDLGKPIIGKTYKFEDLPNALREFQGGNTMGKLVIKV